MNKYYVCSSPSQGWWEVWVRISDGYSEVLASFDNEDDAHRYAVSLSCDNMSYRERFTL